MNETQPDRGTEISFSRGGLLYALLSRTGLKRAGLSVLSLQILIVWLITWVPLLVMSVMEGQAVGKGVKVPFLYDFAVHVRFLIVAPLFLTAEVLFGPRIFQTIRQFVTTGLVGHADLPAFQKTVQRADRLEHSIWTQIVIIGVVVAAVILGLQKEFLIEITSWQTIGDGSSGALTPAGWWFVCVCFPLYQFLLLRLVWQLLVFDYLLWQVSRLDLQLIPSHSDRSGGLGFLGFGQEKFGLFILGIASIFASVLAEKIIYGGADLLSFKLSIAIFLGVILMAFIAPLLVFTPKLIEAKRKGLALYGELVARHDREFHKRWIDGDPDEHDPLGSTDMSSLADLGASYAVVEEMRVVPFKLNNAIFLVVPALAPILLLLLTTFSPKEILEVLKGIVL
jgi:hypothetical protein